MAETLGSAVLELSTEDRAFNTGVDRAEARAERLARRFNQIGQSMTRIGGRLTLAITAPLVALGVAAARAFDGQIVAERQLAAAIRAAGEDVEGQLVLFNEFATLMQRITTVGDEVTLQNVQVAKSMGLSSEQAARAAKNAIALGKAFGINESSAIRYTAALEQGDTTMLNRYIPTLRLIENQSERVAAAQRMLADAFGIATAEAQVGLGPFKQMINDLGDIGEQFGKIILDAVNPFIQRIREAIFWVQGLSDEARTWIVVAGGFAAAIGPLVLALGVMVRGIAFAIQGLTLLTLTAIPATIRAIGRLSVAITARMVPALVGAAAALSTVVALRAWERGISFAESLESVLTDVENAVSSLVGEIARHMPQGLLDLIANGPAGDGGDSGLAGGERRMAEIMDQLGDLGGSLASGADAAASDAAKRIKEVVEALQFERDTLGLSNVELRIANELRAAGIDVAHQMAGTIRALVEEIEKEPSAWQGAMAALREYGATAGDLGRKIVDIFVGDFGSAIDGLIQGTFDARAAIVGLLRDLAKLAINNVFKTLLAGLGGGAVGAPFDIRPLGFAHGGSFTVGGVPGIDRNLVAFRASRGERVDILPAGGGNGGGGGGRVAVDISLTVDESGTIVPVVERIAGAAADVRISRNNRTVVPRLIHQRAGRSLLETGR